MTTTIFVPRTFGSVLILQVNIVQSVPGIATLSDATHGTAAIQDVLVDQATSGDVEVGVVTLSDQA